MILLALLVIPLAGAALASVDGRGLARVVHTLTAVGTLAGAITAAVVVFRDGEVHALGGVLRADALSAWMIVLIGLVAMLAAADAIRLPGGARPSFYALFHLFVFTMLLAVTTDDIGVMWVAIEGTTLASVFLVNAERSRESLEAAYKYLLICSVGIALAFVGTVLVYFADTNQLGLEGSWALRWTTLMGLAPTLPARVTEVAFVFVLVGYGTKAGLVPMHTWLPDAHSEAPAPVSALMSGVLLSVGLYAVLRFRAVVEVAAGPGFVRRLLLALGLLSVGVAAAFLWAPANVKRMLAYSSIEHMGLVAMGLGFGGVLGVTGAVLHIGNHALAKSTLFLLSGRIRERYGTADLRGVRGLVHAMPGTARGFFLAMLALLGLPPFGLFVSEVMIFRAGFEAGYVIVPLVALALLVLAFAGLLRALHRLLYGEPGAAVDGRDGRLGWGTAVPALVALTLLVVTGLAWPPGLATALERIAAVVGR